MAAVATATPTGACTVDVADGGAAWRYHHKLAGIVTETPPYTVVTAHAPALDAVKSTSQVVWATE